MGLVDRCRQQFSRYLPSFIDSDKECFLKQLVCSLLMLHFALSLTGCGSGDEGPDLDSRPASELPLLPSGKYISLFPSFNSNQPVATEAAMQQKWQDAITAGMKVGRVQVDWADLEIQPYQYDKSELEDRLADMQNSGLRPFVLISTIDSEGYTLPTDLSDSNSNTFLANGMHLDDPLILERFDKLLDWVVPMIVSYGGWAVAVGNEPGNFLIHYPLEEEPIANFLKHARAYSHVLDSRLALTMTLNYTITEEGYRFHESIIENSDIVSINYYAIDPQLYFDDDPISINNEFDNILAIAGEKYIVFQELGASAGFDGAGTLMGASASKQSDFFQTVFDRMRNEDAIRAVFLFQMVDWDPDVVETLYTQSLINDGLPMDYVLRFDESYKTIGLLKYSDGSERPAWSVVLSEIESFANN